MDTPPLPAGYQLDTPPLPEGYTLDDPGFGSGTMERMRQYRGLDTKGVVKSVLQEQLIDPAREIGQAVAHPISTVESLASQGYEAIRHPRRTAEKVASYYYQNPDKFAEDVALTAFGGPEAKIAKSAVAPEAAMTEKVVAKLTPVEQATKLKEEAGRGIQSAKDSGAEITGTEAKDALNQIRSDISSEFNPEIHTALRGVLSNFEKKIPESARAGEVGDETPIKIGRTWTTLSKIPEPARSKYRAAYRLTTLPEKPLAAPEKGLTVKDLHNTRQSLDDALASPYPQERMAAAKAKESIDNIIEKKMDQGHWGRDMRRYAIGSTVQELAAIAKRSEYRHTQLSAQAKEAALNTEFRNWARPKKDGTPNAKMKMLRKLNPEASAVRGNGLRMVRPKS